MTFVLKDLVLYFSIYWNVRKTHQNMEKSRPQFSKMALRFINDCIWRNLIFQTVSGNHLKNYFIIKKNVDYLLV